MFKTYKTECLTPADLAKLETLQGLVAQLERIPVAEMMEAANIDMNKRQAWCHFGDNNGNNIMLDQLKKLKQTLEVLQRCVDPATLQRIATDIAQAE